MRILLIAFLFYSCQFGLTEDIVYPTFTVNVNDIGIIGDGITNNSNSIQDLIDSTPEGKTLYFPVGIYILDTTLVFRKTLNLQGDGEFSVIKTVNDVSALNFEGTTDDKLNGLNIKDLKIVNGFTGTPTAQGVKIKYSSKLKIEGVTIIKFYTNLAITQSYNYDVTGCSINGYWNVGIRINNTDPTLVDWGDGFITRCTISSDKGFASIYQSNSGGLKISTNKFNGGGGANGPQYHYYYSGTAPTVDALISNTSFENFTRSAIYIDKGTGTFKDVTISGCQMAYGSSAYPTIYMKGIDGISITGNVMRGTSTSAMAIKLENCNNGTVSNTYTYYSVNPVTQINCTNVTIK